MIKQLYITAGMLGITLLIYILTAQIDNPTARQFPNVILVIMLILTISQGAQTWLSRVKLDALKKKADATRKPYPAKRIFITFVSIVIYFVLMERIGFYVSGFLFFLIITLILQEEKITPKGLIRRTAACFAFMGVLFLLFHTLLAVQTPKGILF